MPWAASPVVPSGSILVNDPGDLAGGREGIYFGECPWLPRRWSREGQFWCMTLATPLVAARGSVLACDPGAIPGGRERINFGECPCCSRADQFRCMTLVFACGSILAHDPGARERINLGALSWCSRADQFWRMTLVFARG